MSVVSAYAQERFADHFDSNEIGFEASATASTGDYAPMWLTANRYGLSSVRPFSGYQRAFILRNIENDSTRAWRLGYGLDLALAENHERVGIVQQAYVEAAWKCLRLTIGQKELPLETHGSELTSGDLAMGINARPIPQARLDIDWFNFPWTKGWWRWKLYCSFGFTTDGLWQQNWVAPGLRYARHTLYHEKGLFWRFGREDVFPLTYEIGLRMATQFGGTTYNARSIRVEQGKPQEYEHAHNFRAFWDALLCRGSDETDGTDPNTAGNALGSYVMQLRYHGSSWQATAYWERFFDDQSMLTVQYGIRDMLIGGEFTMPSNPYVSTAVVEWITMTNQSGAVYHDYTPSIHDRMNGRDDYYNHLHYGGWENYGQSIGTPLITSPLYNKALGYDRNLEFYNNRVRALHFGLAGDPTPEWHWRAMASLSRNWGRYSLPLADPGMHQNYFLAEATYSPRWATGWSGKLGLGLDSGDILGNSFGAQLTVRYKFTTPRK